MVSGGCCDGKGERLDAEEMMWTGWTGWTGSPSGVLCAGKGKPDDDLWNADRFGVALLRLRVPEICGIRVIVWGGAEVDYCEHSKLLFSPNPRTPERLVTTRKLFNHCRRIHGN